MTSIVSLADEATSADLATFVARARRVDPDGGARLVGHGRVLAVYVGVLAGPGAPVVLGLRVAALASPADVDVTVPLAALADRFARGDLHGDLALPPTLHAAPWAGVTPPRTAWSPLGVLDVPALRQVAERGIREIAESAPRGAGSAAVAGLRAQVWGRPLEGVDGVPAGAAFAAHALGFLPEDAGDVRAAEPVGVHATGPWRRLSTTRGHVLTRRSPLTPSPPSR